MTDPAAALRWAVRLLIAEAIVVGLLTVLLVWLAFTESTVSARSAAATPLITGLYGAILAALGRALGRMRAMARGPAIVLQMLMIPIGYYMVAGGVAWLGVPVILVGLVGAGLLLAPSTRIALGLS